MRAPGDAVARLGQAGERAAHAAHGGEKVLRGHEAVLEEELRGDRGAQAELPLHLARAEAVAAALDQKAAHHVAAFLRDLGPHQRDVGDVAVGDPALGAVETVAARHRPGARQHAAGIGAEIGLGQTEAADRLAARQARQPVALLLLGAEGEDRVHYQAGLHADEGAQAGVAALELLVDQAVGDVVQSGAAVLLRQVGAEEAELGDARGDLDRKGAVAEVPGDDRQVLVVDELPGRVARQPLLGIEQLLDLVVVRTLKLRLVARHRRPPFCAPIDIQAPDRAPPTNCRLLRC